MKNNTGTKSKTKRLTAKERFKKRLGKLRKDGCIRWRGAQTYARDYGRDGRVYGCLWVDGRPVRAHRFAYELKHGPLKPGKVVRHMCHNTLCVNTDHLKSGTMKQNGQDRVNAGRSKPERTILSTDERYLVRLLVWAGVCTIHQMAKQYKVSEKTVQDMVLCRTYRPEGLAHRRTFR